MTAALLDLLAPILGLLVLLVVAALFVYLQAPGRGVVKLLLVPLALGAMVACPFLLAQRLGYAVPAPLPEQFTFLAHRAVVEGGRKTALEIWLRERFTTRLHVAPYTKELEQMLQDAARGAKGGREARIQRKGKGEPGQDLSKSPRGEYELKFESPADVPKELPPGAPAAPEEPEPITKRYSI